MMGRYAEKPEQCRYSGERLHFAAHVRLGDRLQYENENPHHIRFLEDLMNLISRTVEEKSLSPPLFHVYTETRKSCPSRQTKTFDEFPSWPLEENEVRRHQLFAWFIL